MTPKCAHHPDHDADGGTCERCGTFVCETCTVAGSTPAICRPCLTHLDSGKYVKHSRLLAVLLMIHGGLFVAAGSYFLIFGGFMLEAILDVPVDPNANPIDETTEQMLAFLTGFFGLGGASHLVAGVLQLLAGWSLLRQRGIVLTWVAIAAGLFGIVGCYCFPSAFALGGYAIFVLTRDDVRARFAVRVPHGSSEP